jgi:hypothetical protein
MIRHVTAAIVVALVSSPLPLRAQTTVFKVNADAANVHKGPSTGSPIIGKAPHGTVLEVTRELGSWVRVAWPRSDDGFGYVHVSTGSITRAATSTQRRAAGAAPAATPGRSAAPKASPATNPNAAPTTLPASTPASTDGATAPPPQGYVRAPAHALGVGGRVGGPGFGVGVAARGWSRERFGVQVELSRFTPADDPWRQATVQLAPSVIYALPDRVSDYWWLRPYVGGGPSLQHRASGAVLPGESDPLAGTRFGFQVFGGGEVTLSSLPRFALSADVGYRQQPSIAGVDSGGFGVVVSGHWYVR